MWWRFVQFSEAGDSYLSLSGATHPFLSAEVSGDLNSTVTGLD